MKMKRVLMLLLVVGLLIPLVFAADPEIKITVKTDPVEIYTDEDFKINVFFEENKDITTASLVLQKGTTFNYTSPGSKASGFFPTLAFNALDASISSWISKGVYSSPKSTGSGASAKTLLAVIPATAIKAGAFDLKVHANSKILQKPGDGVSGGTPDTFYKITLVDPKITIKKTACGDGEKTGKENSVGCCSDAGCPGGQVCGDYQSQPAPAASPKGCVSDADQDGIADSAEKASIGTTGGKKYRTDPTKKDTDGDGLSDYDEIFTHNTDPTKADTDGDGFNDKDEIDANKDPNDPNSKPFTDPDKDGIDVTDDDCPKVGGNVFYFKEWKGPKGETKPNLHAKYSKTNSAFNFKGCKKGDFNKDGVLDSDDLGDWLNEYWAKKSNLALHGDMNQEGVLDSDDLGDWLNAYWNQ